MPEPFATGRLCAGQVGYIITGMKSTKNAQIGDTWYRYKQPVDSLPGFKPSKSMIFAGKDLVGLQAASKKQFLRYIHEVGLTPVYLCCNTIQAKPCHPCTEPWQNQEAGLGQTG